MDSRGMKLITLLFVYIFTSSSNGDSSDNNGNHNSITIMGTDGFVGLLKADKKEMFVSSFPNASLETNCTCGSCHPLGLNQRPCIVNKMLLPQSYRKDPGVSLSKNASLYELSVSRKNQPDVVCLIKGRSWVKEAFNETNGTNCLVRNWTAPNIKSLLQPNKPNITCLKPQETCQTAKYKEINCITQNDTNIIGINETGTAVCYKCGSPVQSMPSISNISHEFKGTKVDAGKAADTMNNLSSLIPLMGNLTEASVSMGPVQGVVKKITDKQAITTVAFIHSLENGVTILNDMDVIKDFPGAFIVPKEAAEKAFNQTKGNVLLGLFRFPNMTKDENNSEVLNNAVYAIEMGTDISNLSEGIQLSFVYKEQNKARPVCASWNGNGTKPTWITDGCNTTYDKDQITCLCYHLTFFAVLMSPVDTPISNQDLVNLTYITYIGCGLSMFFLGIGLFMHFLLRKAKASNSVHVLINLFVALFLLNLTFLSNEYVARMNQIIACRVMAGLMHYCMLASFTWFAVEAFHLCLQMAKPTVTIDHYITKIRVVGWVPPALVVTVIYFLGKYGVKTIQTDTSNNGTMCWIIDSSVHYGVNIGYYCFVFIFTFSTFIVILRWIYMLRQKRWNKMEKIRRSKTSTSDVTTVMGLCCMLGLTWSFSFFSYGVLRVPSYYIFTILNSFQGFFLFIYYIKSSSLFGDATSSEGSKTSEDTTSENPYDN